MFETILNKLPLRDIVKNLVDVGFDKYETYQKEVVQKRKESEKQRKELQAQLKVIMEKLKDL